MTKPEYLRHLQRLGACSPAVRSVEADERTPAQRWAANTRGDWMLWMAARAGMDRKPIVLAACACARLALKYVPECEERPRKAIETAEAWARGEPGVTLVDVRGAADAVYSAAAYSASAAAYSASADAAYSSSAAAYSASAACAAAACACAYARTETLKQCADVVRKHIQWEDVERALERTR